MNKYSVEGTPKFRKFKKSLSWAAFAGLAFLTG
jgi:hypothetical protein